MNIEKLAKYLKEFTLDEIEMIAECDVLPNLKNLLLMANYHLKMEFINTKTSKIRSSLLYLQTPKPKTKT